MCDLFLLFSLVLSPSIRFMRMLSDTGFCPRIQSDITGHSYLRHRAQHERVPLFSFLAIRFRRQWQTSVWNDPFSFQRSREACRD